jgi:hypothetical protein
MTCKMGCLFLCVEHPQHVLSFLLTIFRGHGLDNNDITGSIASPSGEGIADIYAALRMGDSCIGRGFYTSGGGCTGKN